MIAAIHLLNLALIGGLAAGAVPIIVHLAHRRQVKVLDWGAMKFLQELLARSRRRLMIQELLLLALRITAIVLLALALVRPMWLPAEQQKNVEPALPRENRVAAVIVFDDSVSTGTGRQTRTIEQMKDLAIAYIDTLKDAAKGSEVSILRLSRLDWPAPDPLYDLDAARDIVRNIEPTDTASDMPALLEAGLLQFDRHISPLRELVVVSDGRDQGWRHDSRGRWAEIQRRLARDTDNSDTAQDSGDLLRRRPPNLVLLTPSTETQEENLAISRLALDRSLVTAGQPVGLKIALRHHGERPTRDALLRVTVDGRVVAERPLDLEAGRAHEMVVEHTFKEPGSHAVKAVVEGVHDSLPADDERAMAVVVARQLPVLLVEGTAGESIKGSLGILSIALDPNGDDEGAFRITRVAASEFDGTNLDDYRVVVLGDVPALEPTVVSALERYIVSGGGVLVGLGPNTDLETANRFWARSGDGFLPAPLEATLSPDRAAQPAHAEGLEHPALSAFTGRASEAWKSGRLVRWCSLDSDAVREQELSTLMRLDSGHPLLVERRRGLGRVMMFTSSLDLSWGDFCVQEAYVALMRTAVSYLGSHVYPPRNILPGLRLTYPAGFSGEPVVEGPDEEPVEMERGQWEGRAAYLSAHPLTQAGIYSIREQGGAEVIHYAVQIDGSETRLEALDADQREQLLGRAQPVTANDPNELQKLVDPSLGVGEELWHYLLLGSVIFLFLESALTRHLVGRERAKVQAA